MLTRAPGAPGLERQKGFNGFMRLFKSIIPISFVTALALLYVHQQVELVKLSYAIEYKEKKVKDMLDRKGGLGYNINNLEAPSRLEDALSARNIDVSIPKRNHVVVVAALQNKTGPGFNTALSERRPNILGILNFFSPRAEAQGLKEE